MQSRFFLSLALVLGATNSVAAHAPPAVFQIVSSDPATVILSTNRGFVFGDLATRKWSLLCSEAFGVSTGLPYRTARLPSGRLLVADSGGLRLSDDNGCTFRRHALFGELSTPDIAKSPDRPSRVYLTVYAPGKGGVYQSDDGGETFTRLLTTTDDEFVGSLLVAPGEPPRLYAAITGFGGGSTSFKVTVARSTDGGARWARTDLPITASENDVTLLAVNPARPDELLARANGSEPIDGERVLHSRDGGATFSAKITLPSVTGAAFSRDGKTAYISYLEGLSIATDDGRTFAPLGEESRISSVDERDGALLATGFYQGLPAGLDGVGTAPANGSPPRFSTLMNFDEVRSQVSCPAPSRVSADCDRLWYDWQTEFSQLPAGNMPDAGTAPTTATATATRKEDSGCALGAPRRGGLEALTLALLALLVRLPGRSARRWLRGRDRC